ncbi:DUF4105 domain-containing protein [Pseudotenacibaculum sp. MALMAid0570]|uniref:lipoprotein N-acyltransferase Lnb domain-containing protein n=1 Tax=Pseudotenacibaculum sp. MALMAid0570 TaxID=3143938 RepID=UPI0032DFDB7A
MRKIYFILFLFFISFQNLNSQSLQLSVYSEVSIITVGPGNEFFETFGHSAIRIKDPVLNFDLVYNYGMFNFNQPNFYANFAKGRLLYRLGRYPFHIFVKNNNKDHRWIKQQVLDLNQQEKQAFFQFLENNALPQNADYYYDPYFDNCATKLRDITKEILGNRVQFPDDYASKNLTLRQLMNKELPWNHWGSFGINLALGTKLDKTATPAEYMYLPDYVFTAFKDAEKNENGITKPLIKKEIDVLSYPENKTSIVWYNPLLIFSILLLIAIVITYKDLKSQKQSKWFDFIVFFFTGILGVLIAFLWFFTDHKTTPNNFNFLWAFAPNIIIAFLFFKKKLPSWMKYYIRVCCLLLFVLVIIWVLKIQLFSLTIIPILLMLILRYYFLNKLLSSEE